MKEEVYDTKIEPLMKQIIEVCQENKIATFATFCLDGDLRCTTSLPCSEDLEENMCVQLLTRIMMRPWRA